MRTYDQSLISCFLKSVFVYVVAKYLPGAIYPQVPASVVKLEESGFRGLAMPKSATIASNSEFNKMLLVVKSRWTIVGMQS